MVRPKLDPSVPPSPALPSSVAESQPDSEVRACVCREGRRGACQGSRCGAGAVASSIRAAAAAAATATATATATTAVDTVAARAAADGSAEPEVRALWTEERAWCAESV